MKLSRDHFPEWNRQYLDKDFELQVLLQHLEVCPEQKILEVGCNNSELSNTLYKLGCKVWGIDVVKNNEARFKFIHGNFQDIELPDNYFDIAIDVSAIHHFGLGNYGDRLDIDADITTSKKIYKALKNKGLFYISNDRISTEYNPNVGNYFRQYNIKEFIKRIVLPQFKLIQLKIYLNNVYPIYEIDTTSDYSGQQMFALLMKE